MLRMFSIVSSQPRRKAAAMDCGGSFWTSGRNTRPRDGNQMGSGSALISIGLEPLLTIIETVVSELYWRVQKALIHAGDASSKVIVWGFGAGVSILLPLSLTTSTNRGGAMVTALMTSPALRPALAAGEPGATAVMWGRMA